MKKLLLLLVMLVSVSMFSQYYRTYKYGVYINAPGGVMQNEEHQEKIIVSIYEKKNIEYLTISREESITTYQVTSKLQTKGDDGRDANIYYYLMTMDGKKTKASFMVDGSPYIGGVLTTDNFHLLLFKE
jgi:hypothetical protein